MIHSEKRGANLILRMEYGKVNTLDVDFLAAVQKMFEEIKQSDTAAVILTGTGSCFSAGLDLFKIVNGGETYIRELIPQLNETLTTLFTFPKPVVAAINGHAIAGGCIVACACDARIMVDGNGKIGAPELLVGVPFPVLPLEILRYTVPAPHFQNMIYTGHTYLPKEARECGLIDEVAEQDTLLDRACLMIEKLAAVPTEAFSMTKRLMRQPVLDRWHKYKGTFDPEAEKIWISEETKNTIREYLNRTIRK